jgi:predicted nucleic acid-binding protein
MVLVDTSVWIEHLRFGHAGFDPLLIAGEVISHPIVIGELACGTLKNRKTILSLLKALPSAVEADHAEVMDFLGKNLLMGRGLGLIDVHLMASAFLSGVPLWTLDKKLRQASSKLGIAY